MNNTFSLQQMSRTGNLDTILESRQYKLNLIVDFMRHKNENPKMKQSEISNQLSYSSSSLQRYRNKINMLPPYRFKSNKRTKKASNTNFNNKSHHKFEVNRPQMTSKDLETTQTKTKSNKKNKNNSKAGSIHENTEINDRYSDEILNNNDI